MAQPISWEPKVRRLQKLRVRKVRLAVPGFPSTHWASWGLPHDMRGLAKKVTEQEKEIVLRPVMLTRGAFIDEAMWQQLSEGDWRRPLPPMSCDF